MNFWQFIIEILSSKICQIHVLGIFQLEHLKKLFNIRFHIRKRPIGKIAFSRCERQRVARESITHGQVTKSSINICMDVTKTENGERGMGNGEWGMGNGEWGMRNEEWGMGNGE